MNRINTKLHSKADRGVDEKPTQAYAVVRRGKRGGDNEGMRMKATWYKIREVQEFLGYKHLGATIIHTHIIRDMTNVPLSPLDVI